MIITSHKMSLLYLQQRKIIQIYNPIRKMQTHPQPFQNREQQSDSALSLSNWIYASLAIFLVYTFYKIKQAQKRKRKIQNGIKYIEKGKIIIAIQIKDFVVKFGEKNLYGYLPLNVQTQTSFLETLRRKIFSIGDYYKPMFSVSKIKQFMFGLSSVSKISLMLYTSLSPEVAEVILCKLGIDKCFPMDMRKYCDLRNQDDQKHAIQVDKDSRRVIIITPAYDDHRNEDDKYFLVLRPKPDQPNYLKNWLKQLKLFVESNENINNLHDELAEFKINIESEASDYQM